MDSIDSTLAKFNKEAREKERRIYYAIFETVFGVLAVWTLYEIFFTSDIPGWKTLILFLMSGFFDDDD